MLSPEIRARFYGRHWLEVVRPPILERDGYRCRKCGLAHGSVGYRTKGLFHPVPIRRRHGQKLVTIYLQVAHVNHIHGDDRPENLITLCPRDHILHDKAKHKSTRQIHKDQARPLLAGEVLIDARL